MIDLIWESGLNFVLGVCYDLVDVESIILGGFILFGGDVDVSVEDIEDGFFWNVSILFKIEIGLIFYIMVVE